MTFSYPTDEKRITSPFGQRGSEFHNGIDLAVPIGSQVKAAAPGIVLSTYSDTRGGNQMILLHDGGWKSGYAHLSAYKAREGEYVKRGAPIALSGATGAVTGPHLHFTVTNKAGEKVDPASVLGKSWLKYAGGFVILLLIVLIILWIRKKYFV